MHIQQGDVYKIEGGVVKHRKMTDEELKNMIGHIRLNTGFSLPDQLIQDFMNDGSIVPSFKKCVHFNRNDFNSMVQHLKVKRKRLPKKVSKKISNSRSKSRSKSDSKSKPDSRPKSKPKRSKRTIKVVQEKSIKK
jgi:hypothetical protein